MVRVNSTEQEAYGWVMSFFNSQLFPPVLAWVLEGTPPYLDGSPPGFPSERVHSEREAYSWGNGGYQRHMKADLHCFGLVWGLESMGEMEPPGTHPPKKLGHAPKVRPPQAP